MEFFIEKQLIIVLNSVILGLIFGAIYDIIRISHIICGIASYLGKCRGMRSGKMPFIIFALFDLVYVLSVAILLSVFTYWQNNGIMRAFIFVPCILGFMAYHSTVGKIVMFFSESIVRFIRLVVHYAVEVPLKFIFSVIRKLLLMLWQCTGQKLAFCIDEKIDSIKTDKYLRDFEREIRFDYLPKKRRKEKN
ncbi:MAG: hypothetical protein E7672_00830 [Ruminococcaceae bacterium]|nr:hypothetical protein [Oscillospiraceae bacterium]